MISPALDRWIRGNATYAQVVEAQEFGILGGRHHTAQDLKHFKFLWAWSTARYCGVAGDLQDRTYDWGGMPVINRRIQRVRRIIDQILSS